LVAGSSPARSTPQHLIELEIIMSYAEEREQLDKDLALYRAMRARIDKVWEGLSARHDELTDRRLAEITDDEIMADTELRFWLCQVHGNHTGAYNRVRTLTKLDVAGVLSDAGGSVDGRDGYENLPMLTLALERDTPTGLLATALRAWFEVWGLGRESIRFRVLESTLSRWGSYQVEYTPGAEPEARLLRNGRKSFTASPAKDEGSLVEVLAFTAIHFPYNQGREADEEDY
jgi:hypothetical protein